MIIRLITHLLLLFTLTSGYALRGSVKLPEDTQGQGRKPSNQKVVITPIVPPSTRVELVGQQQEGESVVKQLTHVHADGGFVFRNITEGSYLVKVLSIEYPTFAPVRVDISAKDGVVVSLAGGGLSLVGSPVASSRLPYPIQFVARTPVKATYLIKPQGFQITSMLKNPMILAAIFGGFVVFVMPKFTNGLDLAELQQEIQREEEEKKKQAKKS